MKNLQLKLNDEFKEFIASRTEVENMLNPADKGVRYRVCFPNGYGASIVKLRGSYGYEQDLWELALLVDYTGEGKWDLEYTELVDFDVLGYLTDEQVNKILKYIFEGRVNEDIDIYKEN